MTRVILDAEMRGKLHELKQPLELCDETGMVLGRFVTEVNTDGWERWVPPFSEEELRASEQSDEWYTTAQVLEHLMNLEKQ